MMVSCSHCMPRVYVSKGMMSLLLWRMNIAQVLRHLVQSFALSQGDWEKPSWRISQVKSTVELGLAMLGMVFIN